MTKEEFDAQVAKIEVLAQRDFGRYKKRLLSLAILGNAYLIAVLLLVIGLLSAMIATIAFSNVVAFKLTLGVALFLWVVLKALWLNIPAPDGVVVNARKSPALFALIEELRVAADGPPLKHVLITDEFNAGVVHSPRFGLFGGYRNYLLLGLPLMKSLTIEQFKAVLAHEFGHLAKGHGRISGWIYRQRLRWIRLICVLEASDSAGTVLFKPFFRWFAPFFSAYSFPLARAHEYEADAVAAKVTSSRVAAEALTSVSIIGSYLREKYWPTIHEQADKIPRPGFAPFSDMGHGVAADLDDASTPLWMERALAEKTTSDDTHPALSDRLRALGESASLAPPAVGQTADCLLNDSLSTISEILDRRWQENILSAWQDRYRAAQQARQRLADLNARAADGAELSIDEACDRAALTESAGKDADASFAQFQALYEHHSDHPLICYFVGLGLLARDDDAGIAMMEKSMSLDEDLSLPCLRALRDYCDRRDRQDDAQAWNRRLIARAELQEAASVEREHIRLDDQFDPVDLPMKTLDEIRGDLKSIEWLKCAYLVKRRVRHLAHRPCYVLGFTVTGLLPAEKRRRVAEVMRHVQRTASLPDRTRIIWVQGSNRRFRSRFSKIQLARIV